MDTADIVQDATIAVWRRLNLIKIQRPGDLEAYVRQAVINRIRDQARRLGRTPEPIPLKSDVASIEPSQFDELESREFFERFSSVLSELQQTEREAVVARFELGYSYEEIAHLLAKPSAAAARMTVNRAIARLQALLPPRK